MAGWAFVAGMVFGIVCALVVVHMIAMWYSNRRRAHIRAWWGSLSDVARKEQMRRISGAIPMEALPEMDRERLMRARTAAEQREVNEQ